MAPVTVHPQRSDTASAIRNAFATKDSGTGQLILEQAPYPSTERLTKVSALACLTQPCPALPEPCTPAFPGLFLSTDPRRALVHPRLGLAQDEGALSSSGDRRGL